MMLSHGLGLEGSPWRPRDAAIAIVAGVAASAFVLVLLGGEVDPMELFGLVVPAQGVGMIAAVWELSKRRSDWRRALSVSVAASDAWGLLIGVVLQFGLSLVAYLVIAGLLGGDAPTQEIIEVAADTVGSGERLLVVVGVVLLAPISEELVFRGVLLGALQQTRSDRFAVVTSAGVFASIHLLDPNAILAVPFLFLAGIVMGRALIETGRLGRSIAIHVGFNGVTVLALFAG